MDENGNIVDPETGEVIEDMPGMMDPELTAPEFDDPENPETEPLPETGEGTDEEATEPTEDPELPEEVPGTADQPIDFGPAPGEEGSYMPPAEPDVPAEPEITE